MSGTKQKVLSTSLKLFNKYGVSNVSLRNISTEMNISVGNLQYHFKKREDIIEALYFDLVKKIDNTIHVDNTNLLESFFVISKEMIALFYEYSFFLLDFVSIARNNKKIKAHYAELSARREQKFLMIANVLIEHGIFRKEELKDEYHNLYKRTEVFSNFWFSSVLIHQDKLSKKCIDEHEFIVSQSVFPYLTDEAKKLYFSLFSFQQI